MKIRRNLVCVSGVAVRYRIVTRKSEGPRADLEAEPIYKCKLYAWGPNVGAAAPSQVQFAEEQAV